MRTTILKILLILLTLNIDVRGQQRSSLSIRKAIDISKERSLYLKSERYNIEISEADVITAGLRPNPLFNNQNLFLLSKNNTSYSSLLPTTTSNNIFDSKNNQLWFQMTKPMQIGFVRYNKISTSLLGHEIAKLNYEKSESDFSFEIAHQFIHASSLYKNLQIYTEIKGINDTIVTINENRLKNGVISQVDVERIKLASQLYLLKIKLIELDYLNDINALKSKLGIQDSIVLVEVSSINEFNFSANIDSILVQGITNRNDIRIAQCSTYFYTKNILLQKSLAYPYLEGGVIFNPQNSISYVGSYATVEVPVFDRNQGGIIRAQVLYRQSEAYLENTKSKANSAIRNAYNSYTSSKEIAQKYAATLKQARSVFESVKYNYLRGNTQLLDFLDAEKSYLNLSIQYKDALNNYQMAYINLLYNIGMINKL